LPRGNICLWAEHMRVGTCCVAFAVAVAVLSACGETTTPPALIRLVRTIVAQKRIIGETVALTGHIRAQDEMNLAFRIDGKLTERLVNICDRVTVGQLVGRLDPQNELNALRSAEADLAAAQAMLAQMQGSEGRLRELLQKGIATRTQYDQALQQLQTAQSQIKSAEARLRTAEDRRSYTELYADTAGAIIAKGAEPGEVIRAGQMIVQIAREGNKDAIFDVPVQLIRGGRPAEVEVYLADNPSIRATGRVREVSPQADPVTRTHQVKIGLIDPPRAMFLGTTVVGRVTLHAEMAVELPGTALTQWNGRPAVWVVDTATKTVDLRAMEISRHDSNSVIVAQGVQDGDIVVTAGVHALRPGQKVQFSDAAQ
jgi:membrane fusion protein, multidrug efflux system